MLWRGRLPLLVLPSDEEEKTEEMKLRELAENLVWFTIPDGPEEESLKERLDFIDEQYRRARGRLDATLKDIGNRIQPRIPRCVVNMRERHSRELSELHKQHLAESETEMSKPIAGAYDLFTRLARENEERGDLERAQAHRERADAVREVEIARRKEFTERRCKAAVAAAVRRQALEVEELERRGEGELAQFQGGSVHLFDVQSLVFRTTRVRHEKEKRRLEREKIRERDIRQRRLEREKIREREAERHEKER
jgi:hypothetical protein